MRRPPENWINWKPVMAMSDMKIASNKKIVVLLLILVGVVYANSLFSGFVWDDNLLILSKQAFFSHPENALKILSLPDAPLGGKFPYYRPLNTLTYMLDHYLWGLHPFWYHLENILLHGLAVVLFYLLLMEVFEDGRLAFLAAVIFALYPVNTEAVDVISNRNTLFCAVFSIASLLFLFKGGAEWTILSLLSYFLALLSKEPAVVLPFFLFSFGLTAGEHKFKIKKKKVLIGFFAVTGIYFLIRRLVLGAFTSATGVEFSIPRLKLMASVYFEHFKLMFFPFRLNALYTEKTFSFNMIKGIVAITGVLLLFYFSLKKKTPAPVRAGAQWLFWGLLLVSNLVKIPSAPVAERFQYTFLFGFAVILGYLLSGLQKRRALAGSAVAAVLALVLGARTFARNFVWHDDLSLYSSMVRSDPKDVLALYDLGVACERRGDLYNAAREFSAALDVEPGDIEARVELGVVDAETGHLEEAVQEFRTALAIDPGYVKAMVNLGVAYAKEGRIKEAAAEFQNALYLDPGNTPAHEYLDKIKQFSGVR